VTVASFTPQQLEALHDHPYSTPVIAVTGGKGGVGKSSITASLVELLPTTLKITMADTDVDAPNLHIITGAVLTRSTPVFASEKALIDETRCTGCMDCTAVCCFSALFPGEKTPVMLPLYCEACGACVAECREQAISIKRIQNGYLHLFRTGERNLVSGELTIGQSSSGKIVDLVKNEARVVAQEDQADYLLIDGPPGIGCPVISSLKGCDAVLAITEPTAAALSDLERLLEVTAYFDPEIGVIINKADIHPEGAEIIRSRMAERGIPILGEIPYDIHVPLAIAQGTPLPRCYPASRAVESLQTITQNILKLFDTIQKERNTGHEHTTCMRQQ
jgi:MinD superfamily P-loop ATPase